jgi:hypothetical protein
MATKKKLLQAAAGVGGAALNVEDVFSTYLYTGTGATLNIVNGIDLAGEGGLVWHKYRGGTSDHGLFDTERGVSRKLTSNNTDAQTAAFSGYGITAFNSNGYTLGTQYSGENGNGNEVVSWTFRKAPKFFDVVTYTGNSTAGRTVSHNLGSVPGMIIIKNLDVAVPWAVYHRSMGDGVGGGADENFYMNLNENFARAASSSYWNNTAPTSTTFTLGTANRVNATGSTYVAYLFAHNNGDGDFGPDADQDIIKCGSYIGGHSSDTTVELGFEPQWILIKEASSTGNWVVVDVMRGLPQGSNNYAAILRANSTNAEATTFNTQINVTPTGFKILGASSSYSDVNTNGSTYIYIAIRRGPMAVPTSATDVFDMSYATDANDAPFPVDMFLNKIYGGGNTYARDRLRGGTKYLLTETTNADLTGTDVEFDDMTGTGLTGWGTSFIFYNWKRAPSYFDVVAYTGNGTAGHTITHNLGVAPEMMWVKRRNLTSQWTVYHSALGNTKYLRLDTTAVANTSTYWNNTDPTTSVFSLGSLSAVNASSDTYIAYLFASLDGVSKVGNYTGNGTNQTIDCGFTSGARFIIIKRYDAGGDWYVWDTERGIVAGNDPHFSLNSTAAQVTTDDSIDPDNSGFIVNQVSATNINVSSATYIFYAIA